MDKDPNDVLGIGNIPLSPVNDKQIVTDYRCAQCGKYFSAARSLALHEKIHIGAKPFKCPVEGCGKEFYVHAMLVRHAHVHSQVREEKCTFKNCTSHIKRFKTKAAVRQHIKNWHSIEKYEQREIKLLKKLEKYTALLQNYKKLKNDCKRLYEENRLLRHNQELSLLESESPHPIINNNTIQDQNRNPEQTQDSVSGSQSNPNASNPSNSLNSLYSTPFNLRDFNHLHNTLSYTNSVPTHKKHIQKPPGFPKKPVPPYSKYVTERYKSIKQANPELSFIQCSKKISYEWKQLEDIVKEEYNNRYKQEMEQYHKEVTEYKLKHGDPGLSEDVSNLQYNSKPLYSSTVSPYPTPAGHQDKYIKESNRCGNNNFSKILKVNQNNSKSPYYPSQHENNTLSTPVMNIVPMNTLSNSIPQSIPMTQPTFPSITLSNDISLQNPVSAQNIDSLLQLSHSLVSPVSGVVLPSHTEK